MRRPSWPDLQTLLCEVGVTHTWWLIVHMPDRFGNRWSSGPENNNWNKICPYPSSVTGGRSWTQEEDAVAALKICEQQSSCTLHGTYGRKDAEECLTTRHKLSKTLWLSSKLMYRHTSKPGGNWRSNDLSISFSKRRIRLLYIFWCSSVLVSLVSLSPFCILNFVLLFPLL